MGGLGSQSPTLGQDRLLAENASTRLSEYQDRTRDAVEQACQAVAGYVWDDPLSEIPIVKTAMGVEVTSTYAPEMRQGEFVDYNFRLDVYSMQDQTPESIANSLVETMERSILPLSQQAEQQGLTLDVRKWIDVLAESRNLPQLRDLWTSLDAPILPNDNPQTKSPNTTRRYVRENRASMTGPGKDALLTQALLGKKMQPAMSTERG